MKNNKQTKTTALFLSALSKRTLSASWVVLSLAAAGCGSGNISIDDLESAELTQASETQTSDTESSFSTDGMSSENTPGFSIFDAQNQVVSSPTEPEQPQLGAALSETVSTIDTTSTSDSVNVPSNNEIAAVEETIAQVSTAEEPVSEQVIAQIPAIEETVVEESVVEETVVEVPVVEETIAEATVVDEIVAEEPVVEEIVAEEPVVEEVVQNNVPETEAALPVVTLPDNLPPVQCLQFPSESRSLGKVTDDDWRGWVAPQRLRFTGSKQFLELGNAEGKNSIRAQLVPSSKGTARINAGVDIPSEKSYRLSQSIFLEPGFEWGRKREGGKIGFGLGGGSAPTGGLIQTDGFTVRFMWRGNGDGTARIVVYSYASDRSQNLPFGDDHPLTGFNVPIGEWFDLTVEVTANSEINVADGTLKAWANGQQLVQLNDIHWQSSGNEPAIQQLRFSTFYGGSSIDWAPNKTTYIRFADICYAPVVDGLSSVDPAIGAEAIFAQYVPPQNDFVPLPIANRDSLRAQLTDLLFEIELELPTHNDHIDWALNLALESATRSLDPAFWADNNSLIPGTEAPTLLDDTLSRFEVALFSPGIESGLEELMTSAVSDLRELISVLR